MSILKVGLGLTTSLTLKTRLVVVGMQHSTLTTPLYQLLKVTGVLTM